MKSGLPDFSHMSLAKAAALARKDGHKGFLWQPCRKCSEHERAPSRGQCAACHRAREAGRKKRDPNRARESQARRKSQDPLGWCKRKMLNGAQRRAMRRGISFAITQADIIVPEICPVLGLKLEMGEGARHDASPSIDRIDPNKGYIPGNVQIISWRANSLKRDASPAELEAILAYVRRWELGEVEVPGPVEVAVELMLERLAAPHAHDPAHDRRRNRRMR